MREETFFITPEKTILTFRIATIGSRIAAQLVDLVIIIAAMIAMGLLINYTVPVLGSGADGLLLVVFGAFPFVYFILLEGLWGGQTVGKKAMGLRVRMADGTPLTFQSAAGRNLLRLADFLPALYFAGMLAIFTTPNSQRFGDMIANTIVTLDRVKKQTPVSAPHHAGVHPMERYLGDLRGMTMDEYMALRKLCDRYPELSQTTQAKLIQEVWVPFAERRKIAAVPNVHPLYLAEATVMKFGRRAGLL